MKQNDRLLSPSDPWFGYLLKMFTAPEAFFTALLFCALCIAPQKTWGQCTAAQKQADSLALVALYNATNGPGWFNSTNWKVPGQPVGNWYGVTVDAQGCVNCVDLDGIFDCGFNAAVGGNNLSGPIPAAIGGMTMLQRLLLGYNNLTGSIPSSIGGLSSLQWLYLNNNQLSGSIPASIGGMSNLTALGLYNNNLTGSIPTTLGNLTNCTDLLLQGNALTGPIPASLSGLNNLLFFLLNDNNLSGCIPAPIQQLCPHVTMGSLQNNPSLATQSWSNFCNNNEGTCCPSFTATLSGATTICNGNAANITFNFSAGTGPYDVTWTGGTLNNILNGHVESVSPSSTTTYTISSAHDANNCTATPSGSVTITVSNAVNLGPVTGNSNVCTNQSTNYSVGTMAGVSTYQWTAPLGATITGQGNANITVNWSGASPGPDAVCVSAVNSCGAGAPSCKNVTVTLFPAQPDLIGGPNSACATNEFSYTINDVPGATNYTWSVPANATLTGGQGSTTATVRWNTAGTGNLCVTASNSCGVSPPRCLSVTTVALPTTPVITGNASPCENSTLSYSANTQSAVSNYQWSVPGDATIVAGQGTQTVTVKWGASSGDLCVDAISTTCNVTVTGCKAISVIPIPSAPDPITGDELVCVGVALPYSTQAVTGATTYNWTLPAGAVIQGPQNTPAVNIRWNTASTGNVCVRAQNTCGPSSYTCFSVTAVAAPVNPVFLPGGNFSPCENATLPYGVTPQAAFNDYQWTYDNGGNIATGQGTANISMEWMGAGDGQLCVTGSSAVCNMDKTTCKTVTLKLLPPAPEYVSGNEILCAGDTGVYKFVPISGATYEWVATGGQFIGSPTGSTVKIKWPAATTTTMEVSAKNSCGAGPVTYQPTVLVYGPAKPGAINGPVTVCQGSTQTYSIAVVPNAESYVWTAPTGAVIQSGQGTTSISVKFNTLGTGSICVRAKSGSCESQSNCKSVTISAPAGVPGAVSGPSSVCQSSTATYSVAPVPGATGYAWTLPPGASFVGANNTVSVLVSFAGATSGQVCVAAVGSSCGNSPTSCKAVTVGASLTPSISGATSFCTGGNTVLDAGTGYASYAWSSSQTTPSVTLSAGGIYTVTVTLSGTCSGTASVAVTVGPGLSPVISGPAAFCTGGSATLDAGSGYTSYAWSSSQASQAITVTSGTTYTVTVTNGSSCTGTASHVLVANPLPAPTIVGPVSICNGNTAMLDAGAGFSAYAWSNAAPTQTVSVTNAGVYSVTVTDGNGCTGTDEHTLMVKGLTPPPCQSVMTLPLPNSTGVSVGTMVRWTATAGCVAGYRLSIGTAPGGSDLLNSQIVTDTFYQPSPPLPAGQQIYVRVVPFNGTGAATGCNEFGFATANCTVVASAGPGLSACPGQSVTLTASGGLAYQWSDGGPATAQWTLVPNASKTYKVTVTGNNGCTDVASVLVTVSAPAAAITAAKTSLCPGGAITLSATPTQAGNAYAWYQNGSLLAGVSSSSYTASQVGSYQVRVTALAGCDSLSAPLVLTPAPPVVPGVSTPEGTELKCLKTSLALLATGGDAYAWANPGGGSAGSGQQISATNAGIYTVTATNATTGCSATTTVQITQDNSLPTATATGDTITCKKTDAGLICNSNTPNVTYAWTGPGGFAASGASLLVNLAGVYTVTVRDLAGCTATATASAVANTLPPTVSVSAPNGGQLTCQQSMVALQAATASGQTYAWSDGLGSNSSAAISAAGIYTVTVTNTANGCAASATAQVTASKNPPDAAATGGLLTCAKDSLNVLGNSTAPGATYTWSGPNSFFSTLKNPVVKIEGIYTVTVTNSANGCTATATAQAIQDKTPPTASATGGTLTCTKDSLALSGASATPGVLYAWTGPNGFSSAQQSPFVKTAGTYTLTVRNPANGCTATAMAEVMTDNGLPSAAIAAPNGLQLTCNQPNVLLEAPVVAGNKYAWAGPGGSGNQPGITAAVAGTYTLTVTDPASGCSATGTVVVSANKQAPVVSVSTPNGAQIDCKNASLTLQTSFMTGQTYIWSGGLGNNATASVGAPGAYTVTVTTIANGCTASASVSVTENKNLPTLSAAGGALTCKQDSLALAGSSTTPGAIFAWAGPGGFSSMLKNPVVKVSGTYTCTVTHLANGCTSTGTAIVLSDQTPPSATVSPTSTQITCSVASVVLQAAGGNNYVWKGPGTFSFNGAQPTVTAAGAYTVTVTTTQNGCTATASTLVLLNQNKPQVSATSGALTCAQPTFLLSGNASTSGLTYAWTGPSGYQATGQQQTISAPGTYTLTATDPSNGCTGTTATLISENKTPPTADILAPNGLLLSCSVSGVTLQASGNGAYLWSGGQGSGADIYVVQPGSYTVTVTNPVNGCTQSASRIVSENKTPPSLFALGGQLNCALQQSQQIDTLQASSGASGASFRWEGPGGIVLNGAQPTVQAPGVYTVIVTDPLNGCTHSQQVSVAPVQVLAPTISGPLSFCPGTSVVLKANGGFAQYHWSNGPMTDSIIVLKAGPYVVTVTDARQCIGTASATVAELPKPAPTITGNLAFCAGGSTTLTADLSFVQYKWSNAEQTPAVQLHAPGVYTVTVTSAKGCTGTGAVTVQQYPSPKAQLLVSENSGVPGDLVVCNGEGASFLAGGGAQYCFWVNGVQQGTCFSSGSSLNLPSLTANTTVQVQVMDVHQCIDTTQTGEGLGFEPINITVNQAPSLGNATLTQLASCPGDSVRLLVSVSKMQPGNYQIQWQLDNQAAQSALVKFNLLPPNLAVGTLNLGVLPPGAHSCKMLGAALASTGCTSTWPANNSQVDLTVLPPIQTTLDSTFCAFTVDTSVYHTGVFIDSLQSATGCDSIVTRKVTLVKEFVVQREARFCWNEFYIFYGDTIKEQGIYTKHLQVQNGCDSMIVLHLEQAPHWYNYLSRTICPGEGYTVGNMVFTKPGKDTIILTSFYGCDSVVILTLSVDSISVTFELDEVTICAGQSTQLKPVLAHCPAPYFSWSTGVKGANVPGIYVAPSNSALFSVTVTNAKGCKIADTIRVNVVLPDTLQRDTVLCRGEKLFGKTVEKDTVFTRTVTTAGGCTGMEVLAVQVSTTRFDAEDDLLELPPNYVSAVFQVREKLLRNDGDPSDYHIRLVRLPRFGQAVLEDNDDTLRYTRSPDVNSRSFSDSLRYELCPLTGCPGSCDSAWVVLRLQNGDLKLLQEGMPNLITPDDNFSNDFFDPKKYLEDNGMVLDPASAQIYIYNRWGEVVYHPDPYAAWDGKQGKNAEQGERPLPQATYYYLFQFERDGELYQWKGAVNLLR